MASTAERRSSTLVRQTAGFLAVTALVGLGTYGVLRITRLDPFERLRRGATDADRIAIELGDVQVRQYREGKLVSSATVGRITVMQDRRNIEMSDIRDGVYRGERGEIGYRSASAHWNSGRKLLSVPKGAEVSSKDFKLAVPKFEFDAVHNRLAVPGAITGMLLEGDVHAANFAYNTETRNWIVGSAEWTGPISLAQAGDPPEREIWTIKAPAGGKGNNEVITYRNAYAENQAGDTIVRADSIVQNRRESTITATGNVRYFSAKANMTCAKAVIYTKEKRAVLTGGVDMIVKPKDAGDKAKEEEIPPFRPVVPESISSARPTAPKTEAEKQADQEGRSGDSLRKYPIAITAGEIEYWYKKGERRAVITGSPQALQNLPNGRWRRAWTAYATYDGEAEKLKCETRKGGQTRMKTWLGDDVTADWIEFSTREGVEEWTADGLQGKLVMDTDDTGGGSTPPPGSTRTTGGGGAKLQGRIGG